MLFPRRRRMWQRQHRVGIVIPSGFSSFNSDRAERDLERGGRGIIRFEQQQQQQQQESCRCQTEDGKEKEN